MDMKIRKRVSKEDKNKMRQKDPKQGEKYGEVKERGCKKRCWRDDDGVDGWRHGCDITYHGMSSKG